MIGGQSEAGGRLRVKRPRATSHSRESAGNLGLESARESLKVRLGLRRQTVNSTHGEARTGRAGSASKQFPGFSEFSKTDFRTGKGH